MMTISYHSIMPIRYYGTVVWTLDGAALQAKCQIINNYINENLPVVAPHISTK